MGRHSPSIRQCQAISKQTHFYEEVLVLQDLLVCHAKELAFAVLFGALLLLDLLVQEALHVDCLLAALPFFVLRLGDVRYANRCVVASLLSELRLLPLLHALRLFVDNVREVFGLDVLKLLLPALAVFQLFALASGLAPVRDCLRHDEVSHLEITQTLHELDGFALAD